MSDLDDKTAENWYRHPPKHELMEISDELGFSLKQFMTWFEEDIEVFIQTVGPTPSVGGAIPKLLLTIPDSGWDGRIGLPTREKTPGVIDVVLKFEQTTRYPGITELEALARLAPLERDARLVAERVQPPAIAVHGRPGARAIRQRLVPAVHHEHRRPRRAPVLGVRR